MLKTACCGIRHERSHRHEDADGSRSRREEVPRSSHRHHQTNHQPSRRCSCTFLPPCYPLCIGCTAVCLRRCMHAMTLYAARLLWRFCGRSCVFCSVGAILCMRLCACCTPVSILPDISRAHSPSHPIHARAQRVLMAYKVVRPLFARHKSPNAWGASPSILHAWHVGRQEIQGSIEGAWG